MGLAGPARTRGNGVRRWTASSASARCRTSPRPRRWVSCSCSSARSARNSATPRTASRPGRSDRVRRRRRRTRPGRVRPLRCAAGSRSSSFAPARCKRSTAKLLERAERSLDSVGPPTKSDRVKRPIEGRKRSMRALIALLAVAVLLGVVYVGVGLAGQEYLFGIVIPYIAIAVFLVGLVYRILLWAGAPVPFRIPTTCGQQKSLPWIKQNRLDNPSSRPRRAGAHGAGSAAVPLAVPQHAGRTDAAAARGLPVGQAALGRRAGLPLVLPDHLPAPPALLPRADAGAGRARWSTGTASSSSRCRPSCSPTP